METLEQLKWGIAHDPCKAGDRIPLGAVALGSDVTIVLRVSDDVRHLVTGADLVLGMDGNVNRIPMSATWQGFECNVSASHELQVAYYHFELALSYGDTCMYVQREDARSTAGMLRPLEDGPVSGFQISLHEPAFATPSWVPGTIMYQVFPDRFARGGKGVRDEGVGYHEKMNRPVHMRKGWDEPLSWAKGQEYDPVDFYGGTLSGIREKLPYLASLGVGALYLNPVFEARSNHRYDTADYEHIDPLLGTDEEFAELCREAAGQGISVILDAVLSHTGSDSRYFNANGSYGQPGAAQGPESPYRAWYDFAPGDEGAYSCWWGDPSLPEVDERNESWQRYVFGKVLPKWLAAGARGYRLDVADEIPDDVLEKLRTAVKAADPDAVIIGEVWEDATTKESYGVARTYALGRSLDSVMNYPLREALIGFATGETDAYQLATFLKLQQSNYPKPLYHCLMNLLSSHDVERIRTVLALGRQIRHDGRLEQHESQKLVTAGQDAKAAKLQAMLAGLVYALPGMPCIYYGDERGMQGGSDPFCRAPMAWDDSGDRPDVGADLTKRYRELGAIRTMTPTLRNGEMACIAIDEDVICVLRVEEGGEGIAIVVANRGEGARRVVLDVRSLAEYAGMSLPEGSVGDGMATISVQPLSVSIYCA